MQASETTRLYEERVRLLPAPERLRLIALIRADLALEAGRSGGQSLLDLPGLAPEIWADVDVDRYVDNLRIEWEPRE